jgi:alpha-2-macroglobulin
MDRMTTRIVLRLIVTSFMMFLVTGLAGKAKQERKTFSIYFTEVRSSKQIAIMATLIEGFSKEELSKGSIRIERVLEPLKALQTCQENPQFETEFVKDMDIKLESYEKDRFNVIRTNVILGKLHSGLYKVSASVGDSAHEDFVLVSDVGLVVKRSVTKTAVYTASVSSGLPVISEIWFDDGCGKSFQTNKNGFLETSISVYEKNKLVIARSGRNWAIAGAQELPFITSDFQNRIRGAMFTDRTVYRPGDTVYWYAVLYDAKTSKPFANHAVTFFPIYDFSERKTDAFGMISGKLTTNEKFYPGIYSFKLGLPSYSEAENRNRFDFPEISTAIQIKPYKQPDIFVQVTSDRTRVVQGETFQAKARILGLSETEKAQSSIIWTISKTTTRWQDPNRWWLKALSDPIRIDTEPLEVVIHQSQKIDQNNEAILIIPTLLDSKTVAYHISAKLEGTERKVFAKDIDVVAYVANLRIKTNELPRIIAQDKSLILSLETTDLEYHPVKTSIQIKINVYNDNFGKPSGVARFLTTKTVLTDINGRGKLELSNLDVGNYLLEIQSLDSENRPIFNIDKYQYLGFQVEFLQRHVTAQLDREEYQVGDLATLNVELPKGAHAALVSIDLDNPFKHQVVRTRDSKFSYRFRVTPELRQGANIQVDCIVDTRLQVKNHESENPENYAFDFERIVGERIPLKVSNDDLKLDLKVTTDKASYQPGEMAQLDIQTLNTKGKPSLSFVNLSMVDEGTFLFGNDDFDAFADMFDYPKPPSSVNYEYSDGYWSIRGGILEWSQLQPPSPHLSEASNPDDGVFLNRQINPNISDTAVWQNMKTDLKGHSIYKFNVPNDQRTWRITARAFTKNGEMGVFRVNIKTVQNLSASLNTAK